jgi:hypothetical protein
MLVAFVKSLALNAVPALVSCFCQPFATRPVAFKIFVPPFSFQILNPDEPVANCNVKVVPEGPGLSVPMAKSCAKLGLDPSR